MKYAMVILFLFGAVAFGQGARAQADCLQDGDGDYGDVLSLVGDQLREAGNSGDVALMVSQGNDAFETLIAVEPPDDFSDAHGLMLGAIHYGVVAGVAFEAGDLAAGQSYLDRGNTLLAQFNSEVDAVLLDCGLDPASI